MLVDGDVRLDCRRLHDQATALAQALLSRMPTGSVVSFMLPNWHEAAVVYLGATLAGMVVNPILPSLRDRELRVHPRRRRQPNDLRAGEVRRPRLRRDAGPGAAQMDSPPEVVVRARRRRGRTPPTPSLLDRRRTPTALPALDPDAVRMILYTSGTTGRPKGVLHSHNSIHALICQLRDHWLIDPGDTFLVPSPIAHIGGSIYAFECPLLLGTTAVLMDRWDADDAVALMVRRALHPHGGRHAVPRGAARRGRARRHPAARPQGVHLRWRVGAAVADPQGRSVFRARGGHPRLRLDGGAGHDRRRPWTTPTMRPTPTVGPGIADVKLRCATRAGRRDPRPRPADAGRLPASRGRRRRPSTTRATSAPAISAAGSTTTTSSSPAAPRTSSSATARTSRRRRSRTSSSGHPDIAEIAVVGLPDARTGERACAVIVPATARRPRRRQPARASSRLTASRKFKVPEQVVIWECLPKNDAGKVLKHQIRAALTSDGWTDMQVAIVTGASSGIGFGCATKLAEMGMAVLGTGRDESRLAELGEGDRRSRSGRDSSPST